jgi:hypothetical protein
MQREASQPEFGPACYISFSLSSLPFLLSMSRSVYAVWLATNFTVWMIQGQWQGQRRPHFGRLDPLACVPRRGQRGFIWRGDWFMVVSFLERGSRVDQVRLPLVTYFCLLFVVSQ